MLFILMLQLHSTQKLLLVMLTAPLAIIGVTLALLVSNRPFGFVAMLGVFALVGMIIRNSVVLMAQIKENEDAGMERGAAIVDATMHRLRPILLTAAAAILGLDPDRQRSVLGSDGHRDDGRAVHRDGADADLPAGAVCGLVSGAKRPADRPDSAVEGAARRIARAATTPIASATVSITVRYCSARFDQRKRSMRARAGGVTAEHQSLERALDAGRCRSGSTHMPGAAVGQQVEQRRARAARGRGWAGRRPCSRTPCKESNRACGR